MRASPAPLLPALATGILFLSSAAAATAAQSAGAASVAGDVERGRRLFVQLECASCHGGHGEGDFGPAIAATRLALEQVRVQLRSPSSRRMPTFSSDKVSDEEIADLYAFLQSLEPPTLARKRTWWGTDLLNLPTPRTPHHRELELHFSHRFSDTVRDAGIEGLFGLDSFAFPGFWLQAGLTDRVAVYGGRTANLATWEIGVKAELLRERDTALPVAVGVQLGGAFLDADGVANASRLTIELPVGVRVSDRLALQAVPIYTTDPDEQGSRSHPGYSFALGLGASLKLSTTYGLEGEWIRNLAGFDKPDAVDQWQAGVSIQVGRHLFQLLASNSVQTTPDVMAGGTFRTGIKSNIRFGFNLVRGFSF